MAGVFAWSKPIPYAGGKHYLVRHLLRYVPSGGAPYCEPFAGGASLFWAREPAPIEVLNDLDGDLVNFYRALQNPESFQRLKHVLSWTLYSRSELARALSVLSSDERDAVVRAWAFFVSFRMGFGGRQARRVSSWGYSIDAKKIVRSQPISFANSVESLGHFAERLRRVYIEHDDGLRCIARFDNPDAVFYIDPPYHPDTLRDKKTYRHMMTREQHRALVDLLLGVKGAAVVSGYEHTDYEPLVAAGWRKVEIAAAVHSEGITRTRKQRVNTASIQKARRIEVLWINPRATAMLESAML